MISIKLNSNFIEITLQHGCSPVKLLHISGGMLLSLPKEILGGNTNACITAGKINKQINKEDVSSKQ